MNSAKQWTTVASALSRFLGVLCLIGFWALMTAPNSAQLTAPKLQIAAQPQDRIFSYRREDPRRQINLRALPSHAWVRKAEWRVDPALVLAIIQQESNFNTSARSPAGARGAMQIMPDTARYMIKRYRLNEVQLASAAPVKLPKRVNLQNLNDPAVNLLIGQHYIKYLSDKSYIDGNLIYLLTAYNAGPGNLIRWQKQFSHFNDPVRFMQQIPYKETRHYVKKVLANYYAWQARLYGERGGRAALAQGVWPTMLPSTGFTQPL